MASRFPFLTSGDRSQNVDNCVKICSTKKENIKDNVSSYKDYELFVNSLGRDENKLFVFNITHGSPVDEVLKHASPFLKSGDIILDSGN